MQEPHHVTKVSKATQWKPGVSGNPTGKPIGTRHAFSQGFIRDFALVWQEEGLEAVRKVARKSPESFVAIAAKVCPADVRVSIEPSAGGLSPEDWILVQQVVQAVKAALPDAAERNPTEVFQFVLGALRQADAKTINGE